MSGKLKENIEKRRQEYKEKFNLDVFELDRELLFEGFKRVWRYGHPVYYDLIIEICKIHELKNKGYGIGDPLGNFKESERFGIPAWKGALVRLSDKVSRIYNLVKHLDDPEYEDAVNMESIEDTLMDLANYALLIIVLLREAKKND
ncbi:DUF1599-containing protein [uncultured archaeal virus]|uniref:DUF1599-containing protein n=1 Tax=uncultured archaeal virus TaxID=1960247 RepID=A0A1S5Y366_9VIRU|nr:DUF1599-containing protein [uncultured archaeal virus]